MKLQALVRGHLVRKQATATLRCMHALVTAQARARCQRIRASSELNPNQRQSTHRKLAQEEILRHIYDVSFIQMIVSYIRNGKKKKKILFPWLFFPILMNENLVI